MTKQQFWYKTAIFYECYVRAFKDSNSDGWGDLNGLTQKLDYLKDLGVDTIWLLPISPSPLRDDGYDVSDYCDIHPGYGNLDDFANLVKQIHQRNLKILVELVPNHTSDQHDWFIASHDPHHPDYETYKDFYVWRDSPDHFTETRIIFIDSEKSNWTYDPLRKAYYWHRFFSHQPDLNYENPEVQQAMLDVIKFWVDQDVDGIRVDAPPYLFEREGTNCENLPETHTFLKRLRAFVDDYSPGTMLLSEANQWPEDVVNYFGNADEMHMNFHFPLMPRLFMALAKADYTPIKEILARTPEIPQTCQWGTFLRCHDELTLEMVSPEERQWMWETYAPDPRMRLNLGIRRRLAPLCDNDQRKILLLNSLLFTMGGSPFIYYGDELGMGDNIWLNDRNGVRTPMQWDDTRNAGFSSSDADSLYAPVINDQTYGPQTINVAKLSKNPDSILNKIRHMIATRKNFQTFGWGDFNWVDVGTKTVAAYARSFENERLVILNNLGAKTQTAAFEPKESKYIDILTQQVYNPDKIVLQPYEYLWLKQES